MSPEEYRKWLEERHPDLAAKYPDAMPVGGTPSALTRESNLDRFEAGVGEPELDAARWEAMEAKREQLDRLGAMSRQEATEGAHREVARLTGWTPPSSAAPGVVEGTLRAMAVRRVPGAADPRDALSQLTQDYVAAKMNPVEERAYRLLLPEGVEGRLLGTPEEQQAAREELMRSRGSAIADAIRIGWGFSASPDVRRGAEAVAARLPQTQDSAGTPLEVPETAALRFFGDFAPSVASELVMAAPVPTVLKDGEPLRERAVVDDVSNRIAVQGQGPVEAFRGALEGVRPGWTTWEKQALDTSPEERGLFPDVVASDRFWWTRAYMRAMQKLEQNRTLGDDLEASAAAATLEDPDSLTSQAIRKGAYATGLALQTFMPWELAAKPVTATAKGVRLATQLPEGMQTARTVAKVATGQQMDLAKDLRNLAADALQSGGSAKEWLDDLGVVQPDLADTVRAMLAERGVPGFGPPDPSPWEQLRPKAPDLPPSPGPLRDPPPAPIRVDVDQVLREREVAGAPSLAAMKDRLAIMLGRPVSEFEDSPEFSGVLERLDDFFRAEGDRSRGLAGAPQPDLVPTRPKPPEAPAPPAPANQIPIPQPAPPAGTPGLRQQAALDAFMEPGGAPAKAARAAESAAARAKAAAARAAEKAKAKAKEVEDLIARIRAQAQANVEDANLDRPLRSMGEYYDWVTARTRALKGHDRAVVKATELQPPPGAGHEALRWMDPPDLTPASGGYRLTNKGQVVTTGTLDEVTQAMKSRRHYADRIDYDGRRSVAAWRDMADDPARVERNLRRQRQGERVVDVAVDRDFASLAEGNAIKAATKDVQIPLDVLEQQLKVKVHHTGLPEDTGRRLLAAVLGDRSKPVRAVRHLTPDDIEVLDAVQDAMTHRLRATLGPDELVSPRAGMFVTRSEWGSIESRAKREMAEAGYDPARVGAGAQKDTGRVLDWGGADNLQGLQRYLGRYGVSLPAGATDIDYNKAIDAVLKVTAGRAADARWAHRGTGQTSQRILNAIAGMADAATRTGPPSAQKLGQWLQWVAEQSLLGFDVAHGYKLSTPARAVLDQARRSLGAVHAELLADLQAVRRSGVATEDALATLIPTYRPIPERELDLAEAVRRTEDGDPATWRALRDQVLEEVRDTSRWPGLHSERPQEVADAVLAWAKDRTADVDALGRQIIEAALVDHPRSKELLEILEDSPILNTDQTEAVWRSFLRDGDLVKAVTPAVSQVLGPAVAEALPKLDADRGMVKLALILKSREIRTEVARKLAEIEFGTADDALADAVDYVVRGGPRPGTLTDYDLFRANAMVNRLGLVKGGGAVAMGKWGELHMPKDWAEELKRAASLGVRLTDDDWAIVSPLYRTYKNALTRYNPAFHVTSVLGIPAMALQENGLAGTARIASAFGRNMGVALALAARTSGVKLFQMPTLLDRVSNSVKVGSRIYSIEAIERAMLRGGASQGQGSAVAGRKMLDELNRASGLTKALRVLPADLHDFATGISDLFERAFRSGAVLEALERGESLDAAAAAGRTALYDFDNLTPLDKWMASYALTFWKFHRKNLDAFWRQVADNPHRVGVMLRFAQHQRTALQSEEQKALTRDTDLGRVVLGETDTPLGRMILSTGSVLTAPEAMLMVQTFGQLLWGLRDPSTAKNAAMRLAGQATPLGNLAITLPTDVDPGTGRRNLAPMSNHIPPALMNWSVTQPFIEAWFDPQRMNVPPGSDPGRAAGVGAEGPYVWVPGSGLHKAEAGDEMETNIREWRALESLGWGRLVGSTLPDLLAVSQADSFEEAKAPLLRFFGGNLRAALEPEMAMRELRKVPENELQQVKAKAEAAVR